MSNCQQDIKNVFISTVSNNSFAVICKNNYNHLFYYSYVKISESDSRLNNIILTSLSDSNTFSNVNNVGIQGKDLGFFFNKNNEAYLYLLFMS